MPGPWHAALLVLAAFRLTRLVGWDTVTEPARIWLTGYQDDGQRAIVAVDRETNHGNDWAYHPIDRKGLAEFIHCPWCQGFWTTLAWWALWLAWPHATLWLSVPLALSAGVGIIAKNLDD